MNASKWKGISKCVLIAAGLLMAIDSEAWVARGGGHYYRGGGYHRNVGYYHGGYRGGYYRGGYYGYRNVGYYGVPYGAYYPVRCTYMQQCYPNGSCFNKRICR